MGDEMNLLRTLFFYFLVYSLFGWIIEGLFNLFTRGHFMKPNFLISPLKPMYGIAAVLLIMLAPRLPLWLFIVAAFVVPVTIEYLTAYLLLHYLHLQYWDYSNQSFQLSGFICLKFAIYWGILSFFLITYIHPLISLAYESIASLWFYFFPILLLLFITDFLYTHQSKRLRQI